MILKTGKYKMSEKEKKINAEYKEKRKSINAEELGSMFESKVKTELAQYMNLFDKMKTIQGEGFYSKLNTSVNREQTEQLATRFFYSISTELGERAENIYRGEISDVELNLVEDADKFFSECSKMKIDGSIQFPEEFLEEIKISNPDFYEQIQENNKEKTITEISISLTGYLGDLYNLVHETTHCFTLDDNATARILDEVAPQCMERMLDDFLLELPEEELKKYNFNKTDLKKDIRTRRIISFISRYKASEEFNQETLKEEGISGKGKETLKYFLAQLFQTQFVKNDKTKKKEKILEFMKHLGEDDFEETVKSFGMDIRNKLKRGFYIQDTVNEVKIELQGHQQNKRIAKKVIKDSDKDDREI